VARGDFDHPIGTFSLTDILSLNDEEQDFYSLLQKKFIKILPEKIFYFLHEKLSHNKK